MTNEQIKNEFSRWIDADRPRVWYKSKNVWEWTYTVGSPSWDVEATYIVDDEYSKLRKAFYDGKTIQALYGNTWKDVDNPDWTGKVEYYRIKPEEPVYEWQYARPLYSTKYTLDSSFYTEEEALDTWFKIEPSKRERKG